MIRKLRNKNPQAEGLSRPEKRRGAGRAFSKLGWKAALVPAALVAMGALGVALPAVAATAPTQGTVSEGQFDSYCKQHYPGGSGARLVENTAYGWECVTASGQKVGISVASVCQELNPDTPNVVAWIDEGQYFDPRNAWQCTQLLHKSAVKGYPFGYQGALDLEAYCKTAGYDKVALTGDTVADWKCEASFGSDRVDMLRACDATYGDRPDLAIPIFNYWDPYSVRCWR